MTHADTLEEELTDLYLLVDDLKRRRTATDEAVKTLEKRIERLERKLNHKGGAE